MDSSMAIWVGRVAIVIGSVAFVLASLVSVSIWRSGEKLERLYIVIPAGLLSLFIAVTTAATMGRLP
jgi:hypothetical protein